MSAGSDVMMHADGIEGEVDIRDFEGWINVEDFSWDKAREVGAQTGARGGRTRWGNIRVLKRLDDASVPLMRRMAENGVISLVEIVFRKSSGDSPPLEYYRITLHDALPVSIKTLTRGTDVLEEVMLNYDAFDVRYQGQESRGHSAAKLEFSWDITAHE